MKKFFLLLAMVAAPAALITVNTAIVQAADQAKITLQSPGSVKANQTFNAMGSFRLNGKPVAGVPVVLFIRPFGGPDQVVATGVTNANGNYHLSGKIPNTPGKNVQISVVSGGAPKNVARTAVVLPVVR